MGNKTARTVTFFYTILLHSLVFLVLYKVAHTESCKRDMAADCHENCPVGIDTEQTTVTCETDSIVYSCPVGIDTEQTTVTCETDSIVYSCPVGIDTEQTTVTCIYCLIQFYQLRSGITEIITSSSFNT
ncbi:Protein CASP [Mizuhopecten yessoensis]|uniref:Protein CASP n=1 Tax=Mizuhopecten yessoensis TaxID=6573 RepID=A0A210R021_MIZYE|nr:Protein CASP [Mizuhopecten yessoensis]